MSALDCPLAESLILDGFGTGSSDPRLAAHLQECAACRELLALHGAAAQAFAPLRFRAPESVWRRIAQKLARPAAPAPGEGFLARLLSMWKPALALAGALVLAIVLVRPGGVRYAYAVTGSVRTAGGPGLAPRGELAPGGGILELSASSELTLSVSATDRIVVTGPGRARLALARVLELGAGRARVEASSLREEFIVRVPSGEIKVSAAVLTIEVQPGRTIVEVERGRVLLVTREAPDGRALEIAGGERGTLERDRASRGIASQEPTPSQSAGQGGSPLEPATATTQPPAMPPSPTEPGAASQGPSLPQPAPPSPSVAPSFGATRPAASPRPGRQVQGGF